jgi:hypothetical protein
MESVSRCRAEEPFTSKAAYRITLYVRSDWNYAPIITPLSLNRRYRLIVCKADQVSMSATFRVSAVLSVCVLLSVQRFWRISFFLSLLLVVLSIASLLVVPHISFPSPFPFFILVIYGLPYHSRQGDVARVVRTNARQAPRSKNRVKLYLSRKGVLSREW